MLYRGLRITIAPELFVANDLIRVEQRPRFKMRRQMHRAQTALQVGNRSRHRREAIGVISPLAKSWSTACSSAISSPPSGFTAALMRMPGKRRDLRRHPGTVCEKGTHGGGNWIRNFSSAPNRQRLASSEMSPIDRWHRHPDGRDAA